MNTRSFIVILFCVALPMVVAAQPNGAPLPPLPNAAPGLPQGQIPPPPPPPPPSMMSSIKKPLHPLMLNMPEIKFGSQGLGIQSCLYVTVTNIWKEAEMIKKLYIIDGKNYNIPSPSQQMLPVIIQPTGNLTMSVCFKPTNTGEHDTRLIIISNDDSVYLPIQGKGLKAEDLAKLPKTGITIVEPTKKSKQWLFKLRLLNESRITMQVFNDLGTLVHTFLTGDVKPAGIYEQEFDTKDKAQSQLLPGTYYLRCVVEEVGKTPPETYTKAFTVK